MGNDEVLLYTSDELKNALKGMRGRPYTYGSPEDGFEVVGVAHGDDPGSSMVKEATRLRDEFMALVPREQVVFMIEGVYDDASLTPDGLKRLLAGLSSEVEAVKKFGEKGALLWTAWKEGIEIVSPERPQAEIIAILSHLGFSKDDISLYLTVRQLTSEIGHPHPGSTPDEARSDFARFFFDQDRLTDAGWISTDTRAQVEAAVAKSDMAALAKLTTKVIVEYVDGANHAFERLPDMAGQKLIPSIEGLLSRNQGVSDLEKVPIEIVNVIHDPGRKTTVVNRVSCAWNHERDRHIIRQIAAARARGKKPFVLYGASHAIAIEPALRARAEKGRQ